MREPADFERLTAELIAGFAAVPGARGLVLLGSTAAAWRRDAWSDHDFFAIVENGPAERARPDLEWLPQPERVVFVGREGEIGFSVLYADGHLLEFALAGLDELSGVPIGESRIALGDPAVQGLVDAARTRAQALPHAVDAANEVGLALVKLLVGYGRARRGERVVAGQFVRCWAIGHLLRAVRARVAPAHPGVEDPIDAARRFDADYPDLADQLDRILARRVEPAAVGVVELIRAVLEPDWDEFPSGVADVVQSVIGEYEG